MSTPNELICIRNTTPTEKIHFLHNIFSQETLDQQHLGHLCFIQPTRLENELWFGSEFEEKKRFFLPPPGRFGKEEVMSNMNPPSHPNIKVNSWVTLRMRSTKQHNEMLLLHLILEPKIVVIHFHIFVWLNLLTSNLLTVLDLFWAKTNSRKSIRRKKQKDAIPDRDSAVQ